MALIQPVTRLSANVIRILGCNPGPMTLQGTNTYLLGSGKKRILIDTGDQNVPEYIKHLTGVLRDEQATINTIILTHWHHDHVGGVKEIVEHCSSKVNLNTDVRIFKYDRTDAEDFCPEIPDYINVEKLVDEQEFIVGDTVYRVHHTPGHTTDHVIVTSGDGKTLFSGDCILGEGTAIFDDLYDYMNSLHKILNIKPDVIYPGHGNIIEDPVDKVEYYIAHRKKREGQILKCFFEHTGEPLLPMDVVRIVYQETPEQLWPAAAYNVQHHLDKLIKDGKLKSIKRNNQIYYKLIKISSL